MGNCHAAEAAAVMIQHPPENGNDNGKVERIYHSTSANQVMVWNPGYYVALVLEQPQQRNRLKLLKPDDTLHIGHLYRLIPFEGKCADVLKEFAAKKSVKLGKLLKESGVIGVDNNNDEGDDVGYESQLVSKIRSGGLSSSRGVGRLLVVRRGQWRPALPSIAESPAL